ncbi:MAG TPA: M1 family metallopeptidase [Burkholderiales bacterium]|nr:M1 family metallopeptidase [Burkholderiales bacterium]
MRDRLGHLLFWAACGLLVPRPASAQASEPGTPAVLNSPVLRYEIWVELDDTAKMLSGKEDIVWTNRAREAVPDMLFHLYWNAFKNVSSTFLEEAAAETFFARGTEPKDGDWGWIDVTDIRLADGRDLGPTREFVRRDEPVHAGDQTVLRVRFPEPVKPGDNVRLRLEFRSKIPRTVARSGYYRNSYFIGQWFPKPGVYEEGRGWNCHEYHESSEFFSDFADFTVHMTVPMGFVVGSSGKETSVEVDQAAGKATHTFSQAMVHDFAWMADPRYVKFERTFVAAKEVGPLEYKETAALLDLPVEEVRLPDVKMTLLIAPEHKGQIERHFKALRTAIKYYGLWYGPYPYETVTMVDPPFRTASGGMEYPTLFTAGTRVLASADVLSPEGVIIHEFGHGYWYGLAANNEFEEAWLDEGINTYSTGRVLARTYGPSAFSIDVLGIPLASIFRMPKFLDYETDRAEAINTVKYDPVFTASWRFYNRGSYGANVYARASTCLNTLERLVGEQTMARIMRTFQMRFRFRHPKTADFVEVANEVSGRDLTWFFDELMGDTLNFDYGIASVESEERAAHPRGVFDVDGRKEEMTAAKAREIEGRSAGKDATKAVVAKEFLTTVTLRRFGEARVQGDVRVKFVVAFADGTQETGFWDGQGRWERFVFAKPAKALWAKVDPDLTWLVDSDLANNTYVVRPVRRGLARLFSELLHVVQTILELASSFS